jgi:hypothetical protein
MSSDISVEKTGFSRFSAPVPMTPEGILLPRSGRNPDRYSAYIQILKNDTLMSFWKLGICNFNKLKLIKYKAAIFY